MRFSSSGIGDVSYALLFLGALLNRVNFARADNPIVQTLYTADPAPFVYNDRMYLFLDHDEDGSTTYVMKDWRLYSSEDMANWQDHGVVASLATFSWATERAWAGQVIARNDKFYYYVPMRHGTGNMAVGVAVSNNITGPYKDALGKPLVENGNIDPTVIIDDDGQAYLYWGNPGLYYVKLNKDMISYSGSVTSMVKPTAFTEGPWVQKRGSLYYLIYAANCCSEDIRYGTSTSPTGPWTYHGIIMPAQGKSFTNHPGVVDYKNASYFFYHNGALPGGSGYTRSTCVEKFVYNNDGTIPSIPMTSAGPPQIGTLDPYVHQEAETIAFSSGLKTEVCSEGGLDVTSITNGDYIKVKGVAFGTGAKSFTARVASATSGGKIELRLGSKTGNLISTCTVASTGAAQKWTSVTCPVTGATGTQDLFFVFTGTGTGLLFNFNWWQFASGS
ncbi:glycosyl hydrolase [Tricladium varicosporioides]|nr:glycosyl hydrolase [Hymenoscyphus varicosporioides]